jgi:pimeloyl-ACP methyl ester carboxylesterase
MTDQAPPLPSLLNELRVGFEWARLIRHPVYRGVGVERGDGRPVMVLPGLFANDIYLGPMRTWLKRIGYRPLRSGLLINAGCADRMAKISMAELERERALESERLALIGHSRGGVLALALASRLGERVSHLVMLGSPAGLVQRLPAEAWRELSTPREAARPSVVAAGDRIRRQLDPQCSFPACDCELVRDLRRPLHAATRVCSIWSANDPIVSPLAAESPRGFNVEVHSSHGGLAFDVSVYREIAAFLARH